MKNVKIRLKKIIDDRAEGKPTVFAKKAGIPHSTFYAYMKGRSPHSEHLCRICETYNVNINWLLTGSGDPYIKGNEYLSEKEAIKAINYGLLKKIILSITEGLEERKFKVSEDRESILIALLMEYFENTGNEVNTETISKFLKLIEPE